MTYLLSILITGFGATVVMDFWGLARQRLFGVAAPDYCLVGRWFGHMTRGRFRHASIVASPPVRAECLIGWTAHYLTGIAYAAILIGVWGLAWVEHPEIIPPLIVSILTLAAPFLLMQPGMGAGIAASRTPRPAMARMQSLISHIVFGFGLYAGGWSVHVIYF